MEAFQKRDQRMVEHMPMRGTVLGIIKEQKVNLIDTQFQAKCMEIDVEFLEIYYFTAIVINAQRLCINI